MNERIVEKIDTNTYNKISNTFATISICSVLAGQALSHAYIDGANLSYLMSVLGCYEVLSLYINNNKEKTIDGKEVYELYREFIKNYSLLNKKLELKNPIEIFTVFNYLYNKGYLSKDKKFKYNLDAKTYNVAALMGANVITGEGVCRHISGMLSDIMNESDIDSINLSVYLKDYFVTYQSSSLTTNRQRELFEWVKANALEKNYFGAGSISLRNPKPILLEVSDSNIICNISGNHAITYANKDGMNYYLDPTSGTIFRMCPINKKLYSAKEVLRIKSAGGKLLASNKTKYKELFDRAKEYTDSISLIKEKRIIDRTTHTIKTNIDMFEDFYDDNKELYDEISHKLLRLK